MSDKVEAQSEKQQATEEDDFPALFAASEANQGRRKQLSVGDVVQGRVIAVGQDSAFVAVGAKGEAVLSLDEFRMPQTGEPALQVGDLVEATVVDDGRRSGSILLKKTLGRGAHLPAEIEQALAHRIAVEGLVTGENKGGFDVQIGGVRAFCPFSQIDVRRGPDKPQASQFVGQRLRFYVTKVDSGGRNVVVSRRELLEEENAAAAAQTWERLQVGSVVTGVVRSLRDFGAFLDIGGVDGLIHISELGYGRVGDPSEVLSLGQTVDAQVLRIQLPSAENGGRGQVALSLRALARDPWSTVSERFPVGSTVPGVVKRLEAFGAFVELEPGLEGLVHVSKLTLDRRIAHARQVVQIGQKVEVTVLGIDSIQRRVSLSMVEQQRQSRDEAIAQDLQDETRVLERTNRKKSFGSFADLLSDTSDSKKR